MNIVVIAIYEIAQKRRDIFRCLLSFHENGLLGRFFQLRFLLLEDSSASGSFRLANFSLNLSQLLFVVFNFHDLLRASYLFIFALIILNFIKKQFLLGVLLPPVPVSTIINHIVHIPTNTQGQLFDRTKSTS